MISGAQIRAARALLGISAKELASISDVAWSTVQRYEAGGAAQIRSRDTADRIQVALEAQGIEFLGDPVESPGVRLKPVRNE
ncbi:helix-turn-helix domain-containing protein [Thermohalobaculum xanthum]|uniref:helix-turn-helix domain-containing protein n=1 Tax=Thermohalobaculum xanthum TaxID=2753746 RepID=UPI00389B0A2D